MFYQKLLLLKLYYSTITITIIITIHFRLFAPFYD